MLFVAVFCNASLFHYLFVISCRQTHFFWFWETVLAGF